MTTESSLIMKEIDSVLSIAKQTSIDAVPDRYVKYIQALALVIIAKELMILNETTKTELA